MLKVLSCWLLRRRIQLVNEFSGAHWVCHSRKVRCWSKSNRLNWIWNFGGSNYLICNSQISHWGRNSINAHSVRDCRGDHSAHNAQRSKPVSFTCRAESVQNRRRALSRCNSWLKYEYFGPINIRSGNTRIDSNDFIERFSKQNRSQSDACWTSST